MLTLQGNLDTLPITEVLELLASTKKTGCLRVESENAQATVWLRGGVLTAGATDRVPDGPFDELVCDLLRFQQGSFVFDVDDRAPDTADQAAPIEDLLDRARVLLAEWDDLRSSVPSLDHRAALVDHVGDEPVTITAEQWPILTAIARGCSVRELAEHLQLTELGVLRTLDRLQALGLTSIQPPLSPRPRHATTSARLA